jgi:cytochrome c553
VARKHGSFATSNPWILASICLVVVFWIVAVLIGFLWYPALGEEPLAAPAKDGPTSSRPVDKPPGFLQLICGGLGFVNTRAYSAQPGPSPLISSDLAWTDATWQKIRSGDSRRGAAISLSCMTCHGPQGISTADYVPNLAGLPQEVIYKELIDYRAGKRNYVVMNAVATGLSDQDMADVAAYYSNYGSRGSDPSRPRESLLRKGVVAPDEHISRLSRDGDPIRNVVACAACHGPEGVKTGAPPLVGQPTQYLSNQLVAFSQGTRTNDINRQMRLIATRLTPEEIERLAEYLGGKGSQRDEGAPKTEARAVIGER